MSTRLDQIVAATRKQLAEVRRTTSAGELERRAGNHVPRGFRRALVEGSRNGAAVIAELKKASPSRGLIRADLDARTLALELEAAGAAALSVLTDEPFFQGSLENLRQASSATTLPCLRKDFVVDEFQILESRANTADAILLIVAALPQSQLTLLHRRAGECGLDVLCEVHDEEELHRAIDAGCTLIGVNNRDLRTFQVDVETSFRLVRLLPKEAVAVAESGLHTGADLARLRTAGYHAFLIGESLMKAASPGEALRNLRAEAAPVSQ